VETFQRAEAPIFSATKFYQLLKSQLKTRITSHCLARSPEHSCDDICDAQVCGESVIAVLADGAGASLMGREAAVRIVENFISFFKSRPRNWTTRKALEEFARLINRSLYNEGIAKFGNAEFLSTVCVAVLHGRKLWGLNVGDSRVYLWRNGHLQQLSEDHCGSEPERSHVLTRAMGMEPDVTPHFFERDIADGDVVLLCSDGISSVLTSEALCRQVETRSGARSLVNHARHSATDENLDDLSAVLVEVREIGSSSESGGARLLIPEVLKPGQEIDGFTLRQAFKRNDRTWVATRDGKSFVLKFAPLEARHTETIHSQFVRESWTATRLESPCFVRAFIPERQTALYYAQEYHPAPTLKHCIAQKQLDVPEAIALGLFLVEASQRLLRFDLVHGDIKPENILVLRNQDALEFKLIDFGAVTEVFSTTNRAGTPSYLAPERFRGAPISERTEMFAIGVTVFESLTGRFPYGEVEPFQTPTFRQPERPAALNPNIPPWLESVLLRAVSADPEERYQSFSEMKFDLENPSKVRPFYNRHAPLLERNPLAFYRTGFFLLLALTVFLLFRLLLAK
jgi:serine/threonine protein kinase